MGKTFSSSRIRKIFLSSVLAVGAALALKVLSPSKSDTFVISAAAKGKKPTPTPTPPPGAPTAPTNLRVTGITSTSVSLAWDPSTDDSGSFIYVVRFSGGLNQNVPQTQTTLVWTERLALGQTYTFLVYAVDFQNNKSADSNTVTATIPSSPTPMTTPVVTVTDVGVRHISIAWSSSGGKPPLRYWVFKDGQLFNQQPTAATSNTFYLLGANTTYTFSVQARDASGNLSPLSVPLAVTTEPVNPDDITPPTMPMNLTADHYQGDREINLFWTQSVDDFDEQSVIRYDVYVNGVLEDITIGNGHSLIYGVFGENTITVIAIDTAGNESTAATINLII